MRLKDYYGPPEVEQQLIDAIMRGDRPQGMGPEFILEDDGLTPFKGKKKASPAAGGVGPVGMLPKYTMSSYA